MKAIFVHSSPEGGRLELGEAPDPHPGPGQVVIAVRAASLNRADLLMRRGTYAARGGADGAPIGGLWTARARCSRSGAASARSRPGTA